jgi:hypothetical protein
MDALIVASGKSSRLINYTKDYLPKYLLNIDNYPALVTIIKYWKKYAQRFFLIIDEKFNTLTQFTIDNFLTEQKGNIHIFNYNNQDGTAYTIDFVYQNYLKKFNINNLLITWCDILPNEELNLHHFRNVKKEKNNLFVFTFGNNCRYLLENNKIIEKKEGNIIGIYYIENLEYNINNIEKGKDIVEYFNNFENIYEYELKDLLDFGDEEKYVSIINLQNDDAKLTCRSFNEISVKNNIIMKKAINSKGIEVIKHEMNFYKNLKNTNEELINLFPKINSFYDVAFSMNYQKNHINLYKYLNNNSQDKNENIISNIINKLNLMHNYNKKKIRKSQFMYDIKVEIYDKIIQRIKNIEDILDYFPKFSKVNGIYINTFDTIIDKIQKYLFDYYETLNEFEYSIIHGDTNFSNILINPENEDIKFIDPRGYFSSSEIYGLTDYDYAKILYGISGYDNFNNHHFVIESINENEIKFNINKINVSEEFINNNFNKIHKILVVIIWIGLADYNKNNIWKCVASYYHGLYLGTLLDL